MKKLVVRYVPTGGDGMGYFPTSKRSDRLDGAYLLLGGSLLLLGGGLLLVTRVERRNTRKS